MRNRARQKLSTLPNQRFNDLTGDVFFELGQRYPEFKEPPEVCATDHTYRCTAAHVNSSSTERYRPSLPNLAARSRHHL